MLDETGEQAAAVGDDPFAQAVHHFGSDRNIADMAGPAVGPTQSRVTRKRHSHELSLDHLISAH